MTARQRFESLYAEHASAVLAYARRRTTPGNADDVIAEVFLVAWRRLEQVPEASRVWLLGVARRVLANQRRGAERQRALQGKIADATRLDTNTGEERGEERVLQALSRLGENDREALLLLGWEQLDTHDAARVLGVSPGTFKVRAHRARKRFARELEARADIPSRIDTTETMEAQ